MNHVFRLRDISMDVFFQLRRELDNDNGKDNASVHDKRTEHQVCPRQTRNCVNVRQRNCISTAMRFLLNIPHMI